MKTKTEGVFQVRFCLVTVFSVVLYASAAFCGTSDGIHLRTSILDPEREFKFTDVPADMPFIKAFPMEALLRDPAVNAVEQIQALHKTYFLLQSSVGEGKIDEVELAYWIHTSVSDAEEAMMEHLCTSNLWMGNAIDLGRVGEIGDNCWYGADNISISFIRNNVRVDVAANTRPDNPTVVLTIAKKVDGLICSAPKVADAKLIPAPIIKSVQIIPGSLEEGKLIALEVDAIDPKGQRLRVRCLGCPLSNTSETAIVKIPRSQIADSKKIKVWVMNEDYVVSSVEMELPF